MAPIRLIVGKCQLLKFIAHSLQYTVIEPDFVLQYSNRSLTQ